MAIEKNTVPNGNKIEHHKFVCAVGDANHNKYWNVTLYDSGDVEIHFGRIGKTENQGVHRGVGSVFMDKKIREKEKGKRNKKTGKREPYKEIDVINSESGGTLRSRSGSKIDNSELKSIALQQIDHAASPETQKLIDWLVDINRHIITDATGGQITFNDTTGLFQTPLGIVTPNSVSQARRILMDIADYITNQDYTNVRFRDLVDSYLTLIPHDLGMKWSPETFLPNIAAVQKENNILDALDASYITATTKSGDQKEKDIEKLKVFETKLIVIDNKKTYGMVKRMFQSSRNIHHRRSYKMNVHKIWEVQIKTMTNAFKSVSDRVGNIMTLWHGTQASNLLSILKAGLVIPPSNSSHCTGRMFGDGLYFSDQSTKALNYATGFWGQRDAGRYFMFLADVAMGKAFRPSSHKRIPDLNKYDSTFAKAGKSGVRNNEMIVYKTSQANLKYLIEFRG
ncbi:MAG: hypothetical protein ACOC80_10845 [Petrotogales bacterium]